MKLSSDEDLLNRISLLYSGITVVILISCISLLLLKEFYLSVGSKVILPLFIFLIIFEIFKWAFFVVIFKRDFTVKYKESLLVFVFNAVNFTAIVRGIYISLISCIGYYVITVLFGAEILNKQEETFMFSILLTVLTVTPISIHLGPNYVESYIQGVRPINMYHFLLYNNSRGALIGAWFGAFVIPLDWDRPWQVWPTPCFFGALIGYTLANCLHLGGTVAIKAGLINKKILQHLTSV